MTSRRIGSRLRSAIASALCLAWLWFGLAAPFAHHCAPRSAGHPEVATKLSATCLSCQWLEASVQPAAVAANELALDVPPTHVYPACGPALTAPVAPYSSRAPPSLS